MNIILPSCAAIPSIAFKNPLNVTTHLRAPPGPSFSEGVLRSTNIASISSIKMMEFSLYFC